MAVNRPCVKHFRPAQFAQSVAGRKISSQVHFELVAEDHIDSRHLPQLLASGLGIAARDGYKRIRRTAERFADRVAAILFGILRDGTGVQHEKVCGVAEGDDLETLLGEKIAEDRCFRLIEAAA